MELLTRKEVADFLRVDPRTVVRWLHSGQLKGYRLGNKRTAQWRIKLEEMEEFLVENDEVRK